MKQLNLKYDKDFEKHLSEYMRLNKIKNRSEAIRRAVTEAGKKSKDSLDKTDFSSWLGLATRTPVKKKKKYLTEDDLWS